jgi:Uncharacterized conserved protein
MPIPQNKDELLEAIRKDYNKLKADLGNIPLQRAKEISMEGHAKDSLMSPYDLVAYLVGWAELVLLWEKKFSLGQEVVFPCKEYKWNELGLLAQKFYKDYPDYNFTQLLELLDQKVNEIVLLIEQSTDQELYDSTWYKEYTMGRMIQLNTSSPYKNARSRIRAWLKKEKNS